MTRKGVAKLILTFLDEAGGSLAAGELVQRIQDRLPEANEWIIHEAVRELVNDGVVELTEDADFGRSAVPAVATRR